MHSGPCLDKRPIEKVSVVGDKDVRLHVQDMVEELLQKAQLVLKWEISIQRVSEIRTSPDFRQLCYVREPDRLS